MERQPALPSEIEGKCLGQTVRLLQEFFSCYHPNTVKKVFPPTLHCLYVIKLKPCVEIQSILERKVKQREKEKDDLSFSTSDLQSVLVTLSVHMYGLSQEDLSQSKIKKQFLNCHPRGSEILELVTRESKDDKIQFITVAFMLPFGDPAQKCVLYWEYTYMWGPSTTLDTMTALGTQLFKAPEICMVAQIPSEKETPNTSGPHAQRSVRRPSSPIMVIIRERTERTGTKRKESNGRQAEGS